jgi:hypothetical protein
MGGIILKPPVTALSCLAIGLGFVIAAALLVFAGVLIGWLIPRPRPRPGPAGPEESPGPGRRPSD